MSNIIPSGVFGKYFKVVDELLNNDFISEKATLFYLSKQECPNCNENNYDGSISSFSNLCPYCGGKGSIETTTSEDIRLRVYYEKKYWIKIGNIEADDGEAQIIGFAADMGKISRATTIEIFSKYGLGMRYKIAGSLFPHGFNFKYFIGYIEKCV